MITYLNIEGYESDLYDRRPPMGRMRRIKYEFRFENGFGAMVTSRGQYSETPQEWWELSVIRRDKLDRWVPDSDYDAEITSGAGRYLTDATVRDLLEQIKNLDMSEEERWT